AAGSAGPGDASGRPQARRVEHVSEVARVTGPCGPEHQVVKHRTAGDVVAVRSARHRSQARHELVVDTICAWDRLQLSFVVELPENDLLGGDKLGDAPRQEAVEVGESVAARRVSRYREQGVNS